MTSQQQPGQAADTTTSDTTAVPHDHSSDYDADTCLICFPDPGRSIERREVIDGRLTRWESCEACGHRMEHFSGRCWSDCGCTSGKHAAAGRDIAGVPAETPARNSPGHGNRHQ